MPTLNHLLLTTVEDAYDPKAWSGIPYSLRAALERRISRVTVFRPSTPDRNLADAAKRLILGGKPPRYPLWSTKSTLAQNAKEVNAEISRCNPDAVLSISSQSIAYIENAPCPIYIFSDAPWMAYHNAYKYWDPMPITGRRFAADEAQAARRADGLFYGSDWACLDAGELFGHEISNKIHQTHLGANWTPNLSTDEIISAVKARSRDEIHLLFVGKDWARKGGPTTVEVARQIHHSGRKVNLHIVGCRPKVQASDEQFITVHGPMYQSDPTQRIKLQELFLSSHFLFVPTLAECFGIVFAEAQAFALPPVSNAVHAVPSVVKHKETGMLFYELSPARHYTEKILECFDDREAYETMCIKARQRYQTSLNWDNTANIIALAIEQKLAA